MIIIMCQIQTDTEEKNSLNMRMVWLDVILHFNLLVDYNNRSYKTGRVDQSMANDTLANLTDLEEEDL